MTECFPFPFVSRDTCLGKGKVCSAFCQALEWRVRLDSEGDCYTEEMACSRNWRELLFLELVPAVIFRRWLPLHPLLHKESYVISCVTCATASLMSMKHRKSWWSIVLPWPLYCVLCKWFCWRTRSATYSCTRRVIKNKMRRSFPRSPWKWKASATLKHREMKHSSSMERVGLFPSYRSSEEEVTRLDCFSLCFKTILCHPRRTTRYLSWRISSKPGKIDRNAWKATWYQKQYAELIVIVRINRTYPMPMVDGRENVSDPLPARSSTDRVDRRAVFVKWKVREQLVQCRIFLSVRWHEQDSRDWFRRQSEHEYDLIVFPLLSYVRFSGTLASD